jgi:hypothetical protein
MVFMGFGKSIMQLFAEKQNFLTFFLLQQSNLTANFAFES